MSGLPVAPADRLRPFVVLTDVCANATHEVADRREDATPAFDLRKPELYLIQPGRVGRREVQADLRMLHEEPTTSVKKSTKASLVCRGAVWPTTSPVCVLSAANNESVPWL